MADNSHNGDNLSSGEEEKYESEIKSLNNAPMSTTKDTTGDDISAPSQGGAPSNGGRETESTTSITMSSSSNDGNREEQPLKRKRPNFLKNIPTAKFLGRGVEEQKKLSPRSRQRTEWKDAWKTFKDPIDAHTHSRRRRRSVADIDLTKAESFRKTRTVQKREKVIKDPCAVPQDNKYVMIWSLFILSLVVYTVLWTPYTVASSSDSEDSAASFIWDRVLDSLFFLDVVLQFFLTYEDPITGMEIFEVKQIARRYLELWFWIDVISVFPYDLVVLYVGGGNSDLGSLSAIRMFRLLKLFKVVAFKRLLTRLEARYALNFDYIELLKYCVQVMFIIHLLACGLMLLGKDSSNSWIVAEGLEQAKSGEKYLIAFYWATMTLSTIGYGDIDLVTFAEKGYAIFAMIIGASFYAYVVGGICNILLNINAQREEYKRELSLLNQFMDSICLPQQLQLLVRDYYTRTYEFRQTDKQREILTLLSPQLQSVVGVHMNGVYILTVPVFRGCDGYAVAKLAIALDPMSYSPMELVVQQGEPITHLIILKKGTMMEGLMCYNTPYFYGDEIILTEFVRSKVDVTAIKYCDAYILSKDMLIQILHKYPQASAKVREQAIKLSFIRTVHDIKLQMTRGYIKNVTEYVSCNESCTPDMSLKGGSLRNEGIRFGSMSNKSEAEHSFALSRAGSTRPSVSVVGQNQIELEELQEKVDEMHSMLKLLVDEAVSEGRIPPAVPSKHAATKPIQPSRRTPHTPQRLVAYPSRPRRPHASPASRQNLTPRSEATKQQNQVIHQNATERSADARRSNQVIHRNAPATLRRSAVARRSATTATRTRKVSSSLSPHDRRSTVDI